MSFGIGLLIFLLICTVLSYQRAALIIWTISCALFLAILYKLNGPTAATISISILLAACLIPLNLKFIRRRILSQPLLIFYRSVMPKMSRTEREAIQAGTITWEADLFRGNPNWNKLLKSRFATLSEEEKAFLEGPVNTLCEMIDDWDITHNLGDLPPTMWQFLKEQGFFALIIPKQYGGKEFSAYAHSQILTKISGCSITVSSTVAVPNSLGPAELLLHYGTEDQKNYYLPRLAHGDEIPCFALTSPEAGSDAGAMNDYGIVCYREHHGQKKLGIVLNWNKRYITLAPVATVIGLAFKLYDPDHLLGNKTDIGITCALIPRNTPGVSIGRRHFPLNTTFMNGPTYGKDVFIPIEWIIGGEKNAGKGWKMLMECLAAGRSISLPASALGGAKVLAYTAGAYARIRKQFNMPIGRFEGIEEPLGRIGGFTYIMDSARTLAASYIDKGEKPAVASAIVKYHVTEMGRKIAIDGMDIFGGKGICLGPNNFIGRGYQSTPIAITVEGANILTRNMIIFGQGAIRCHPYVLPEIEAARLDDEQAALKAFDRAVVKHLAFGMSNIVRSLLLALTSGRIVFAPRSKLKRYYQQATRFCSAFALLVDVSMMAMGSQLKRKESISARLGDILSHLYLLSAVFKQYHVQGEREEDYPIVKFACDYCLYEIQSRFDAILRNFPNRPLAALLRLFIFPLGQNFTAPKDILNHNVAQLLMAPTAARERLSAGAFILSVPGNVLADLQDALMKTIACDGIEKRIRNAKTEGEVKGYTFKDQAQDALRKGIITVEEFDMFMQTDEARQKVIAVDDFSNEDLARTVITNTYQHLYTESDGTNG